MVNTHWASSTSGDASYKDSISAAVNINDLNISLSDVSLSDVMDEYNKKEKRRRDDGYKANEHPCATLSEYRWENDFGYCPEIHLSFQLYSPAYLEKDLGYVLEDFLNEWLLRYGNSQEDYFNNTRSNTRMKIKDVQILAKDKVVRVVFNDETSEKAICNELDEFSLERAIEICICKHLIGGTANFNKAVRKGLKVYDDKLKAEEIKKAEKERIEKKRAKHNAYRDRCRAKAEQAEKEKQIEIQKEAYLRAMREYKEERKKKV